MLKGALVRLVLNDGYGVCLLVLERTQKTYCRQNVNANAMAIVFLCNKKKAAKFS